MQMVCKAKESPSALHQVCIHQDVLGYNNDLVLNPDKVEANTTANGERRHLHPASLPVRSHFSE